MPGPTAARRLAGYERRYRELASELAAQLATIGLVHQGSVVRRYTRCGTSGCRCHAEPPQLHGPYYQWTAKVAGKTVTRQLNSAQAQLYEEWIANDRRISRLIRDMRHVAAEAAQLKLEQLART